MAREARKWYKNLPENSILSYQALEYSFKEKWEEKKNPMQYLSQYHSMKRRESEYIQDFSDEFMKVYNSIPSQFKPPIGSSQLHYVESFDSEFTLWLSERRSASLEAMMKDAIEVEVNLVAARKNK